MRLLIGMAVALLLAGCAPPVQGSISVFFDKPMVPADAMQVFRHCHIHDEPRQAGLAVWQIKPDLSQAQLACLRHQPHVTGVLGGM